MQQFCHQAAVACIGHGDQQTAFGRQPLAACSQDALGLAKVLQHVGADDVVIACFAEELVQVAVFQVGHMDMAVEGRCMACLFLAQGDAVADALLVLGEKGAQRAAAATQIQYVRLGPDMAGQHGQRRALVQIDGAQVDVGIGNGCGHRKRGAGQSLRWEQVPRPYSFTPDGLGQSAAGSKLRPRQGAKNPGSPGGRLSRIIMPATAVTAWHGRVMTYCAAVAFFALRHGR